MSRIAAVFHLSAPGPSGTALGALCARMQGASNRRQHLFYKTWDGSSQVLPVEGSFHLDDHPGLSQAAWLLAGSHAPSDLSESLAIWEQQQLYVAFDGQIYNRDSLWKLLDAGPEKRERSDAWLLLRAYQKWGKDCLARFNGRWAFVLWDGRRQIGWAARDRFGVKPLYYSAGPRGFHFASEPKLLLTFPMVGAELSPEGVFDYFVHSKVEAQPETLWRDILQLMPAQAIHFSTAPSSFSVQTYYELPVQEAGATYEPEQADRYARLIQERTLEAIALRQPAGGQGGRPATLLSGGLDSSVLAAGLQHLSIDGITALTASYRDERFAEQHWAQQVVQHLRAQWIQVWPSEDKLREEVQPFFFHQDTPTFSAGTFAQYSLFQEAARRQVFHLFDGQGADGLMAGHYVHYPAFWSDLRRQGQWGRWASEIQAFGGWWPAWQFSARLRIKTVLLPRLPVGLQHLLRSRLYPELRFLNPDFLVSMKDRLQAYPPSSSASFNAYLKKGFTGGEVNFLLKCVDRASSWFGVETATPFSDDQPLIETVFSIPGAYKIYRGQRKHLLRKAFQEYLPASITDRSDKMGLVTPNNTWIRNLRQDMRPHFEQLPEEFFDKKSFLNAYDRFFDLPDAPENYRSYKYFSFGIWWDVLKEKTAEKV